MVNLVLAASTSFPTRTMRMRTFDGTLNNTSPFAGTYDGVAGAFVCSNGGTDWVQMSCTIQADDTDVRIDASTTLEDSSSLRPTDAVALSFPEGVNS